MMSKNVEIDNHFIGQRSRSNSIVSPAAESVVDAHASRILRINSPAEACIDPNLGPYVTSILRGSMDDGSTKELDEIDEVDSLLELLEEHCLMDNGNARNALFQIYMTVKSGDVEEMFVSRRSRGMSIDNEETAIRLLGQMLQGTDISKQVQGVQEETHSRSLSNEFELNNSPSSEEDLDFAFEVDDLLGDEEECDLFPKNSVHELKSAITTLPTTPLKPATLIPTDLLGALDNPTTPATNSFHEAKNSGKVDPATMETPRIQNIDKNKEEAHAPFPAHMQAQSNPQCKEASVSKSPSKDSVAQDLATTLFKPNRSRSNSILSDRSPKFKPMQAPTQTQPPPAYFSLNQPSKEQLQESTVHMLLSLNGSLSEEAAREAALVTDNDVNIAQFVLEKAMSAPPVCRHMLNNACYRSDCQFSHDIEGHTCLFWLKGRCGKGSGCRFLHGFGEHLLEGMIVQQKSKTDTRSAQASANIPIATTNLLKHNMTCTSQPFSLVSSSIDSRNSFSAEEAFGGGAFSLSILSSSPKVSSPMQSSSIIAAMQNRQHHLISKGDVSNGSLSSISGNSSLKNSPDFPSMPDQEHIENSERSPRSKTFSFAKIASNGYNKGSSFAFKKEQKVISSNLKSAISNSSPFDNPNGVKFATIPHDLWNPHLSRNSSFFHISDPIERYLKVLAASKCRSDVIDLHFQSIKTFPVVLSRILPEKIKCKTEVWIVTGSGHHTNRSSYQRSGGVLETAVIRWLSVKGYEYLKGKDKNGYGGAVLARTKR